MLKRLELQSLRADLQTVDRALQAHTRERDPVGWKQFTRRAEILREQIRRFEDLPSRIANVALFFGGGPVIGSHGIDASFGGRAIDTFQEIVSTRFAAKDRPLGARGPVANRSASDLIIRDVARGSFGFVLEENAQDQLVDTPLKDVMSEVVDAIYRIGAADEEAYEHGLEELDDRLLAKLRAFFAHLDKAQATIRIVDEERQFSLNRDDIQRGRERTEGMIITEEEPTNVVGTLFILPVDKRFELHPLDGAEILHGGITSNCGPAIFDETGGIRPGMLGMRVNATLLVKTVRLPNKDPKRTYKLDFVEVIN